MSASTMTAESLARRLQRLAQLYREGRSSELMDRSLKKLLSYEAEESLLQLRQVQADLAEFEERYHMSSADFFRRYNAGQTDDRMDFVEWASLMQMADNLKQVIQTLTEEDA